MIDDAEASYTPTPPVKEEAPVVPVNPLAYNCWAYLKSLVPSLPNTKYLVPNTTIHKGVVALFNYNGTPHYALVISLGATTFRVKESNVPAGTIGERDIPYDTPSLKGFYGPVGG